MTREEISKKVISIVADTLCDDSVDIKEDTYLINDLDLGSMDVMAMMADFEACFDIEIEEAQIQKMVTVKDIVDFIEETI